MFKRISNQKGLAHLPMILIGAAVVVIIGLAAWHVSSSGSGSKPTVDKEAESACLKEVNDKNLCKFAASYNAKAAYKAVITSTSSDGTSTSNLSTDGNDNTAMTISQAGNEVSASVVLNGDTYIKDETQNTWIKYPKDNTSKPDTANPTSDIKIDSSDLTAKNTITYKYISKEACGKLSCFKYQVVDTTQKDLTQYLWFDDKGYQLQKWSSSDSSGTTEMVFTYAKVTITAPSPSKDFSAASSADIQSAQAAAAAAAAAINAQSTTDTTDSGDTGQ